MKKTLLPILLFLLFGFNPTTVLAQCDNTDVSTLAGSGTPGFMDGDGTTARFINPFGVAVDAAGNVYVADRFNHRVRKITPGGEVSTLAGSGNQGFMDGAGTTAQFDRPTGVAVDAAGNVYVSEQASHRVRKISPEGEVSTLAGSGTSGFLDGAGTTAQFNSPSGIAVDAAGNVYVADGDNHRIRKITPGGEVSTLAGSGNQGFLDGAGTTAQFNSPSGIAVDAAGNVYVSDFISNRIRKVSPEGEVSTLAGSGNRGFMDGDGTTAQFSNPYGVAVDTAGNVYVGDPGNSRVRKISPEGEVSTLAGSGTSGFMDGDDTTAQFNFPFGVAVDAAGNVYVADLLNYRIRKIGDCILEPLEVVDLPAMNPWYLCLGALLILSVGLVLYKVRLY